ncbi:hypothetical protein M5C72_08630 [Companilactobacillus allii]|uniref:Lipoprotein n=1 Tax=Companilactobacillus allii TaxID=1847728 RepID=A0A1P8Q5L4_9LACO|nr:hypothetical protein [Companilactobacillus allii]APX73144.1 hypothetical protein BTM29_11530 [Companilactobacillus allii]USQ67948.1 hypothetical protein M5C72_08630 [Companilactobacillus allii]
MKKMALGILLLSMMTLATACGNNSSTKNSSSTKTESVDKNKIPTANNKKIAKQVEKELNKDGKVGKVSVETEVHDDQSATKKDGSTKPHQVVHALITDKALIKKIDANGNDVDMLKEGIKEIADDYSPELKGHDTITIDYEIDDSQYNTIALNNKNGRIIK